MSMTIDCIVKAIVNSIGINVRIVCLRIRCMFCVLCAHRMTQTQCLLPTCCGCKEQKEATTTSPSEDATAGQRTSDSAGPPSARSSSGALQVNAQRCHRNQNSALTHRKNADEIGRAH